MYVVIRGGEPEVRGGEVLHRRAPASRLAAGEGEALFVTVREYEGVGASEAAMPLLGEHVLPMTEASPVSKASGPSVTSATPGTPSR